MIHQEKRLARGASRNKGTHQDTQYTEWRETHVCAVCVGPHVCALAYAIDVSRE